MHRERLFTDAYRISLTFDWPLKKQLYQRIPVC